MSVARPSTLALLPLAAALAVVGSGCGPSVQSIHEGNVRFEHCYRLDLDPAIAPSHRQACWSDWVSRYTFGQSGDRLSYAQRRIRAIHAGQAAIQLRLEQPRDAGMAAAPAPTPTSIHAPPPALVPTVTAAPPPPAPVDAGPARAELVPPENSCAERCRSAWRDCEEPCADKQVDARSRRCEACEPDYRTCMRRCYK